MREILFSRTLGDTLVRYPWDPKTGQVGLELVPVTAENLLVPARGSLRGEAFIDVLPGNDPWPARPVDSLVQVKLVGDDYSFSGAFGHGHTMRTAKTVALFRYDSHEVIETAEGETIAVRLVRDNGCRIEHRLSWAKGSDALVSETVFTNGSPAPVTLEMLSSFSLCGITPFHEADATGRLRVHRFRSVWSAEGRHEDRSVEELHLERSWSGSGTFSERFGQLGTMPVRRWFPFVAAQDTEAGVFWGAQLCWAGSWQMEIFRQHDDLGLSGGLADREFGHWTKSLQPGESFATPAAWLTCVKGDFDTLCDRLTAMQDAAVDDQPAIEQDLPIIFNDWCTFWGDPKHDDVTAIADRLKGSPVRYQVIDAGWYKSADTDWSSGHGDWVPSTTLFPDGLKATADAIRERGLIPGLWFEMETVGSQSTAFKLGKHFLMRDGIPLTSRERLFWDMNDPGAIAYLTERVADLLESCGFGYLKVDYNETAGLGCDDADSQGEGLRKQVEGGYRFFELLRQRLPDLVIENCSSGGHRLEPSMLGRTAMSSFSDAHELVEIPLIAANLHRLILPRQNQIWAVLHPQDSVQRLRYSLAATFLGRMCLSGAIEKLTGEQWSVVKEAMDAYRLAAPVIKHGTSRKFAELGESWRRPQGWQALSRHSEDQWLIVVHGYENAPSSIEIPAPAGDWKLATRFGGSGDPVLRGGKVVLEIGGDFTGQVLLWTK